MTIKLTIRLFGILGLKVPAYDHKKGIRVDKPDGVRPADLLKDLKIPVNHVGFISDGEKSIPLDARLTNKMSISFYSTISGG
ncbi:MAG: hypothetical protein GY729_07555 [Desulfobacteraceae bacterium]|nr:hypothetical protein [Desulfobacteraceae bacterium]